MNKCMLIGRITRDLELKGNETKVLGFGLAVNRKFKKDGEQEADFINCKAFGNTAEVMVNHLSKGRQIGIEGRIQCGSYEKEGQKIYTTEVIVDSFYFADSKKDGQAQENVGEEDELPF